MVHSGCREPRLFNFNRISNFLKAKKLNVKVKKIDVTPIMEATGIYEILPASIVHTRSGVDTCVEKMGSPSFVDLMISSYLEPEQSQQRAEIFKRFESFMMTKTKVRMMVIYEHGLVEGKLVLGTTDKTEAEIGFACNLIFLILQRFYDPHGDGASDINVLKHLYKSQIKTLAKHIGVPEELYSHPSSNDLLAEGIPNEVLISMSYTQMDTALSALAHGATQEQAAKEAGLSVMQVARLTQTCVAEKLRKSLPVPLPFE